MAEVHETDKYVFKNVKKFDIHMIKRLINVLKDVKSQSKSCVSLVMAKRDEISFVRKRLKESKSDGKYSDAIEGLTSADQILEKLNKVPDNGVIIYAGNDGKKDFAIVFEPSKPIDRAFLRIEYTFNIAPLEYQVKEEGSNFIDLWDRYDDELPERYRILKEEAKLKPIPVVNPQSFAYFSFLFAVGGIITFQLGAVRLVLRQNPSLFKDHGGVFTIIIIVSGSMAVLSSFVLVLSSFLLKNWMKSIHYTILKTIGSFSAILVPFSLGAAVFVPSRDLNWIAYTVLCLIFGGLLYLYSFIWKVACAHEEDERYNSYPVHWAYLLIILVPLSISLLSSFSRILRWLTKVFLSFSIIVLLVIAFMRFNREDKVRNSKHHQQDKTIQEVSAIPNTTKAR